MNIIDKRNNTCAIKHGKIAYGLVFEYQGNFFLKTSALFKSVNLKTGQVCDFAEELEVTLSPKAHLVIDQ